jgi:DNA-binding LacI/PurR family transcriptional regulator
MTVSNAFNQPDELSADLRERILAFAAKVGYHGPSPAGRMLKTGKTGSIALFNPDPIPHLFEDTHASEFMAGISQVCELHQIGLTVLPPVNDVSKITAIDKVAVDGFILYAIPDHNDIVGRVLARGLPAVTVDMTALPDVASIRINDRLAARMAAEHLIKLGHSKIVILSLQMFPDGFSGLATSARIAKCRAPVTRDRLRGYYDAFKKAGINPNGIDVYEIRTSDVNESFSWSMEFLKTKSRRPTAVLAMSDRIASGAIRAALQTGLRVPFDVSVIGFDDALIAQHTFPPLTTVRQPSRAKGRLAGEIVVGDVAYSAITHLLPTELVIRDSTAAPARRK